MTLLEALRNTGIRFELTACPDGVFTADAVANTLGIPPRRVAKAMLLRAADGSRIVAVIPGDRRVDLKAIRRHLNGQDVALVARGSVAEMAGMPVGTVTPLVGLVDAHVAIYFDAALTEEDVINIGTGELRIGANVQTLDLLTTLRPIVLNISKRQTSPLLEGAGCR
jgi:prolyl-tRNA editing enzyme YbaK/EbsC (Cys-tRNA(Pro) deacylase)